MMMRNNADALDQELLAPFEHRAFAREMVKESPVLGSIQMGAAIPAYQLAKLLGLHGGRTAPSFDQLFAGYQGLMEGWK